MQHHLFLRFSFILFALLGCLGKLFSQAPEEEFFSVMSFNVENLFDTIPDAHHNDKEYLPQSKKKWETRRYYRKLRQIAEAISQTGGMSWPWLVALQEVENAGTLQDLITQKGIASACYHPLVSQGADARGIRVALLYAEGLFKPYDVREWCIPTPEGLPPHSSRPILAVSGSLLGRYPLTIFVLHLPSNFSGRKKSAPYRKEAFRLLHSKCDSISSADPSMPILVLGDFNSTPQETIDEQWIALYDRKGTTELRLLQKSTVSQSCSQDCLDFAERMKRKALRVRSEGSISPYVTKDESRKQHSDSPLCNSLELGKMYDVSLDKAPESVAGSYYFHKVYTQIDRILLSPHFFNHAEKSYISYVTGSFSNCSLRGRMKKQNSGISTPLRTFGGDNYIGGTSDHLPIRVTLRLHPYK